MANHPVSRLAGWITEGSDAHYPGRPIPWQTRAFMRSYKYGFYANKFRQKYGGRASAMVEAQFNNRRFRQKPLAFAKNYKPKNKMLAKDIPMNVGYSSAWKRQRVRGVRRSAPAPTTRRNPRGYGNKRPGQSTKNKKNRKVRKRYPTLHPKGLNKQIQDLRKAVNMDKSTHIYKSCDTGVFSSSTGRCSHSAINANTVSKLETYLANLEYYDPSTPGTLLTASGATGTYSRDFKFKNIHSKLTFSNNYMVPARLKVYCCKAKIDSSTGVITTYTEGITDQVITAGADETDALLYLNDIERVKENWDVDCVLDVLLHAGQMAEISHNTGEFNYDPSHVDSFADTYQKQYKAFEWIIRLESVLGHDSNTPYQRTLSSVELDYQHFIKADIEYDAGIQLNRIFIDDNRGQTPVGSILVGVRPISDNVSYSGS